jgi:glycoprotein endo-alpha-1,2-mannosidase
MSLYEHTTATTTATSIGETLSFPFTNLPLAATDVDISVFLRGDLDGGDEWYYVEGDFSLVGYAARDGNKYSQCSSSFVAEDFVVSALSFNNVAGDGQFDVQLRPFRSQINPRECSADAHQAYIKLSYIYCELPSSEPSSIHSEQPSTEPSSKPTDLPPIPKGITVGAYYYPWHSDDFHRDQGYLRDKLIPRQQPTLGEYDDTRPEIVAQHLAWSRQANINLWVTSWWGPGFREDVTISEAIMKHADLGDHQIALLYESTSRLKEKEGWTTQRVAPDMEHICQTFFVNDNYYKVDGKPVMVMYLTRVLHSKGVLGEVTQIMRDTAREVCGTEIYLIGDQVWGNAPLPGEQYPAFDYLDAVTNYDIYGNTNHPPYAGQGTVDRYYRKQAAWRERAIANGVNYVPAVSPGYNDRGVRFQADHIGLSRRLTAESEPGTLFVAQLEQARYLIDPGAGNLLLVNSFNEWHEDSQIEPCIGEPTTEPQDYTNGIEYEGYGELYLDILRVATCGSDCSAS